MLFFAIFTVGYFVGVITALAVFPPNVKEIEEQEFDSIEPILNVGEDREEIKEAGTAYPIVQSS